MPPQRAELGNELQPLVAQLHTHARELRQPDAEVVAMRNHDVAELLEIGAERRQLGEEIRSRQLRVRRHRSKVSRACKRRHGAGVRGNHRKEYTERAVASERDQPTAFFTAEDAEGAEEGATGVP